MAICHLLLAEQPVDLQFVREQPVVADAAEFFALFRKDQEVRI